MGQNSYVLQDEFCQIKMPRKRLDLKEKEKLIEEASKPGFDRKKACASYGIGYSTLSGINCFFMKSIFRYPSSSNHKRCQPMKALRPSRRAWPI